MRPISARTGPCADPAPVVAPDRLEVFVATELVNPLNRPTASFGGRMAEAKRAKRQRDAVALAVWCALRQPRGPWLRWQVTDPGAPKAITLTAHVGRRFDSHDNLRGSLKAVVDGIRDSGLIVDDRDSAGHRFEYAQVTDGRRGVTVAVALA